MVQKECLVKIYLDDERNAPEGWQRTYSVEETIVILKSGQVTHLSLDHDLGQIDGHDVPSGYEVLKWIEQEVFLNKFVPPDIQIHSANSAARPRMQAAIDSIVRIASKNML